MTRDELLLSVTQCPELSRAKRDGSHPCAKIVGVQQGDLRHLPEPWSGHIDAAPILFLSSNPSIDAKEDFPTASWDSGDIADYFNRRFEPRAGYVTDKQYRGVRFWSSVRVRAGEILGRAAVPGRDFALTELVHCKSKNEIGVSDALPLCSRHWLSPVIEHSAAQVVVLLGSRARDVCVRLWELDGSKSAHFGVELGGIERAVVIIPHPNAFGPKKISDHLSEETLTRLQASLQYWTQTSATIQTGGRSAKSG